VTIRVGLIGANGHTRGPTTTEARWGGRVHGAVFSTLPECELVAVCTTRRETAEIAAQNLGAKRAFVDYREMIEWDDIDLVSVAVRVDLHHPMVLAAIDAGKHVYCEWPLAVNTIEAAEILDRAQKTGIHHAVGLQSHGSPGILYLRDLIAQGDIGRILMVNMIFFWNAARVGRHAYVPYVLSAEGGGNALSILGGHSINALTKIFGDLNVLSADVDTLIPEETLADTKETLKITSHDSVNIIGRFVSGAMLTAGVSWITDPKLGWRMYAYGTEGCLEATSDGMMQMSPITIRRGSAGTDSFEPIAIPDKYYWTPEFDLGTKQFNVGQIVRRFVQGIEQGRAVSPNFEDALALHQLVEKIELSSLEHRQS